MTNDELWIQYSHLAEGGFGRVMRESDFKEFMKAQTTRTEELRNTEILERLRQAENLLVQAQAALGPYWFSGDYGDYNNDDVIKASQDIDAFFAPSPLARTPQYICEKVGVFCHRPGCTFSVTGKCKNEQLPQVESKE